MRIQRLALLYITYTSFGAIDSGTSDAVLNLVSPRRPTNGNLPKKDAFVTSSKRPVAKKCRHYELISKETIDLLTQSTIELLYCNSTWGKYESSQKFTNSRVVDNVIDNDARHMKNARLSDRALVKSRSRPKFFHLLSEVGSCSSACKTRHLDCVRVSSIPYSESPRTVQNCRPSKIRSLSSKYTIKYHLQSLPVCKQHEAGVVIKQTAECSIQRIDRQPTSQSVEQPPHHHILQTSNVLVRIDCNPRNTKQTLNDTFLESVLKTRTLMTIKMQGCTHIWIDCKTDNLCAEILDDPYWGTHGIVIFTVPLLPTKETSTSISSPSSSLSSSPLSLPALISPSPHSAFSSSPDSTITPLVSSPSAPSPETPLQPSFASQPSNLSHVHLGSLYPELDMSKNYLQVTQLISGVTIAEANERLFLSFFTIEITAILNIDENQIVVMTIAAAAVIDQYTSTESTDSSTKTLLSTLCETEKIALNSVEVFNASTPSTTSARILESSGPMGIVPTNFTVGVAIVYTLKNTNYSSIEAQFKLSVGACKLTVVLVAAGYIKAVVSKIVIIVVMAEEMSDNGRKALSGSAIASIIIASILVLWIAACCRYSRNKAFRIADETPLAAL